METNKKVAELISVIVLQEEEIAELKATIDRIKQYIAVYEEYLERGK